MASLRVRIGVLGLTLLAGPAAPTTTATATAGAEPSPTVEERRLDRAVPREILRRSGFDALTTEFTRALDSAGSYARARRVVTLLRDRLGLHDSLPGGHVHTPVLEFGAGNTDPATGTVTDPEFVRNRLDIIAQVRTILTVAMR